MVSQVISNLHNLILAVGRDPGFYNNFGAVRTYLEQLPESRDWLDSELEILEKVFARHEVGVIPGSHAKVIKELGRTHSLGVVSNIWSHRDVFEKELRRAEIYDLFDTIVWSSDHGCIKPSPKLFQKALARFPVEISRVLFVGDNLMRDVGGAKAVGMSAVWIHSGHTDLSFSDPQPDLQIPELGRLLTK
jgi:HAD superfamily hydrolase (TIGR01509 family)